MSNPGGAKSLWNTTHAHKSWWQKARESRAIPPCACVGLRWPSAHSLPSSLLPLRCCSVIGFIHATMPLSQHTQLVPKTRSLTLFVLLSTSPLHPNRTQSAHGTGALRQRSSDAMNGGGHYPTYVFRCGGGQLWMWDVVGCERAMGVGRRDGGIKVGTVHALAAPAPPRARVIASTHQQCFHHLEPHECLPAVSPSIVWRRSVAS